MEEFIQSQVDKIAKYILDIILYNPSLPMSWGMEDPKSVYTDKMAGLEITVNGFIHHGQVQILLNEGSDTFEIRLINPDGTEVSKTTDIYIQELANQIDQLVEKTEDYENRITQEYHLPCD